MGGAHMKVGMKKMGAKAHKIGLKMKAGMKKAGLKFKAGMKKVGLKLKAGLHLKGKAHLKIKSKKAKGPGFFIGVNGWELKPGQKLKSLEGSFKSYEKAQQAPAWAGKVNAACKASPFVMEMVKK